MVQADSKADPAAKSAISAVRLDSEYSDPSAQEVFIANKTSIARNCSQGGQGGFGGGYQQGGFGGQGGYGGQQGGRGQTTW